jgi:SAM-dependent methyltransferase
MAHAPESPSALSISTGSTAARPELDERSSYVPRVRQEQFIVPLLQSAIEPALRMHAVPGGRALDVGCGGQPFRRVIESVGMSYTSLDTQQQAGVRTDYLCAIDAQLPEMLAREPRFDLVLCTEVLEHVADWSNAWRNLSSLLAPGGKLIVTCPFFYPLHEEPYDFWRPTEHAIRSFAIAHGLRLIDYRRLGGAREVMGTLLAATKPTAVNGGVGSIVASIMRPFHKLMFSMVKAGPLSRLVVPVGKMYLSNFAVIEKPR